MDKIIYRYQGKPYINLTNACTCDCVFCIRNQDRALWHDKQPTFADVKEAMDAFDFSQDTEVTFCGYGEPTSAWDLLIQTCTYLRENYKKLRIRINTNGLSDLENGEKSASKLVGLVDAVSISLNAPDAETYQKVARPCFGERSFDAMLLFAKECKEQGISVLFSVVDCISKEQIEACQVIADNMGIPLRVRSFAQ